MNSTYEKVGEMIEENACAIVECSQDKIHILARALTWLSLIHGYKLVPKLYMTWL